MRVGISGLAVSNAGGLGRLARTSIIALAAARPQWKLHVYLRGHEDVARLEAECDSSTAGLVDNLRFHFPPAGMKARPLLEDLDLPRQFKRIRLDAYLGLDFTLPMRKVAPVEAVLIPDLLPFTQPKTVSVRARLLYRRGLRRVVQRGARLVCISELTKRSLEEELHAAGATVVHPALSPRLAQLAAASAVHDRPLQVQGTKARVVDPGPFLLYVGDAGPRKNVELLVHVFRSMVEDGLYAGSLVLAGGDGRYCTAAQSGSLALEAVGPQHKELRRQPHIYDLGRVSDSDLSELYANADLLVNLSSEEGFGYPVLEAVAHGTPAVVTKGSAMIEAAPAGILQTVLEPGTIMQTLDSALTALQLLRQEIHAINHSWFNIERMGEGLAQVLEA